MQQSSNCQQDACTANCLLCHGPPETCQQCQRVSTMRTLPERSTPYSAGLYSSSLSLPPRWYVLYACKTNKRDHGFTRHPIQNWDGHAQDV